MSTMVKFFIIGCSIVERRGKILLVQETRKQAHGKWNLPGGRIDLGESLVECAKREGKEETGFIIKPHHLVGIYQYPVLWGHNAILFVFKSTITGGKLTIPHDAIDVRWFSLSEIKKLSAKGLLMTPHIMKSVLHDKVRRRLPLNFITVLDM